jgi:Leucine-rich repeat (LRR) protein
MEEYENYSEIVLIADNNACVRDIELADRIGKPVRIILCGYTKAEGVNPHYAYLAKMTGGGIYTIEKDFEEINIELGEKGEIKTNKEKRFKITKNACKDFDFIDASQTIHPLDYALKNKQEVRKVNASNLSLEKLPNGLYRISKLNYLDLSNNNLSELSPKIERLQYLKTLNLANNKLKDLPLEFGFIRYIENLDLSHNLLDSIPEVLKYSKHLQKLNLSNNAISEVNLITQVKLNQLDLSNNALSQLPKSFTKLKLITDLNLSNNLFTVFPPQLGNLRKILRLDLSNNQLTKLPTDFYKYQRIKHLNLTGNNFSEEEKDRIRKGLPFAQIEF